MTLPLRETRRKNLVTKHAALAGQIVWLFYPPELKPKSQSPKSDLPLIKNLERGDQISILESATNKEIWRINAPNSQIEGGHFYFRADSDFPSIAARSKSYVIVARDSTKRLVNQSVVGKSNFGGKLSKFGNKDKLQLRIDNLWKNWQRIIAERAKALSSRQVGMFITDGGIVGYATSGCKVGDFICADFENLPESGWVAVIGAEGPKHRIVGKGTVLRAPDSSKIYIFPQPLRTERMRKARKMRGGLKCIWIWQLFYISTGNFK